jgi:betaine-aldehyde dehydrogenase
MTENTELEQHPVARHWIDGEWVDSSVQLVQRGIADEVREKLAARLLNVKVGPASDPTSDMGPLINKSNVERVNQMVEDAIKAGAVSIVRGGPVDEGSLSLGAFYKPTLLEVNDPSLPIFQEEVFGPVSF